MARAVVPAMARRVLLRIGTAAPAMASRVLLRIGMAAAAMVATGVARAGVVMTVIVATGADAVVGRAVDMAAGAVAAIITAMAVTADIEG
jgi:hypothetical protein